MFSGKCSISGESYLEDTISFSDPLIKWIEMYCEKVQKPITLSINLSYFDTSSSRSLLRILYVLKVYKQNGGQYTIKWYHKAYDDDMAADIEDYRVDTGIEIERIPL